MYRGVYGRDETCIALSFCWRVMLGVSGNDAHMPDGDGVRSSLRKVDFLG